MFRKEKKNKTRAENKERKENQQLFGTEQRKGHGKNHSQEKPNNGLEKSGGLLPIRTWYLSGGSDPALIGDSTSKQSFSERDGLSVSDSALPSKINLHRVVEDVDLLRSGRDGFLRSGREGAGIVIPENTEAGQVPALASFFPLLTGTTAMSSSLSDETVASSSSLN